MDVQKTIDQAQEEGVEKTPEKAVMSGVISGQPNQEVHENAFKRSHAHDKTLSEPDMIAMNGNETLEEYNARVAQIQSNRFGFYDSEGDGQDFGQCHCSNRQAA